jgi:cell division protein FtsQ
MSRRRALNGGATRTQVRARATRGRDQKARVAPTSRREPTARTQREKPPRRRLRAVLKFVIVAVLVVASVVVAGKWILRWSYFRVQHVTLVGAHHESSVRVLHASGLEAHPAMIGLDAPSIERRLAQFPWITGITIAKHWPNSIVVTVRETSAVAVAFDSHHVLEYVDRSGRDLGAAPIGTNLPTLLYLKPTKPAWPYERAGAGAAYVASQLPVAFRAQVAVISEDARGQVTLKMTTPVSFILGPATQLHTKFVAIASVIAHSTLRPGDVVDVTVPDELAVTGPPPS